MFKKQIDFIDQKPFLSKSVVDVIFILVPSDSFTCLYIVIVILLLSVHVVVRIDPQTSISPKIKKEELVILIGKLFAVGTHVSMICSAQGYPVPYFRYVKPDRSSGLHYPYSVFCVDQTRLRSAGGI